MSITPDQMRRHATLTRAAEALIDGALMFRDNSALGPPDTATQRKLRSAIQLFAAALTIKPTDWRATWLTGKIWQRMGDHQRAFAWMAAAHRLHPTDSDLAGDTGVAAMDAGQIEAAVRLCFFAVKLAPDNLGLQSNLALAYLLHREDARAEECATVAARGSPDDPIAQTVLNFVRDVRQGRASRPLRLSDAFPVC